MSQGRHQGKHTCPKCGREMELALPPDGKGQRFLQCFNCDRPDPLTSDHSHGWLKGELAQEK